MNQRPDSSLLCADVRCVLMWLFGPSNLRFLQPDTLKALELHRLKSSREVNALIQNPDLRDPGENAESRRLHASAWRRALKLCGTDRAILTLDEWWAQQWEAQQAADDEAEDSDAAGADDSDDEGYEEDEAYEEVLERQMDALIITAGRGMMEESSSIPPRAAAGRQPNGGQRSSARPMQQAHAHTLGLQFVPPPPPPPPRSSQQPGRSKQASNKAPPERQTSTKVPPRVEQSPAGLATESSAPCTTQ